MPTISLRRFENVVKVFQIKNFWKGKVEEKYALNGITIDFHPNSLHTMIGVSGSGKSTILRIICGKEKVTSGAIKTLCHETNNECDDVDVNGEENLVCSSSYIDHKFKMTYEPTLTLMDIEEFLSPMTKEVVSELCKFSYSEPVASLLESDRRIFEILLALSRIDYKNVNTIIICLDEYLDKDCRSTHMKFSRFLREICEKVEFNLQIVISTHSRGVLEHYNDNIIVLNKGNIVHVSSGSIKHSSILPLQLQKNMIL